MADAGIASAHKWLDGLKGAESEIACQAIAALRALMESKGFGSVSATVVAGRLKQMKLEQTYQANSG